MNIALRKTQLVFVATLLTASAAHAAPEIPSVDGITLGMTSQRVLHLLRDHGMRSTLIARPCLSDYLSARRKVLPIEDRSGHCVEQISSSYAGGELLVFFSEDVPRRPGASIVTTIALNYPKDPKPIADVVGQAGPPSQTDGKRPWIVALWCFDFNCSDMNRTVGDSKSPPTLLVHQGSGLTLNDARAATERDEAVQKKLHEHGIILEP